MNPRILKKLSKRALPMLRALGEKRESFPARKDENYHGLMIRDRRYWERMRCHPSHREERTDDRIVYTSRAGHRISMWPPCHPLKGTMMLGGTVGYYEPEWEEETAYGALGTLVNAHFTDWMVEGWPSTRSLRMPHELFAAAIDMMNEVRRG